MSATIRAALAGILAVSAAACSADSGVTEGSAIEVVSGSSAPVPGSDPASAPSPATTDDTSGPTLPGTTLPTPPASTAPETGPSDTDPPVEPEPPETAPAGTGPATSDGPTGTGTIPAPGPGSDPDGLGDALYPELGNPGIDVQDYHVRLSWDRATEELTGSVTLTIVLLDDRDEITLDSAGPDVDAVTVDGSPAEFVEEDVELRITPDAGFAAGDEVEVVVEYHESSPASYASSGVLGAGWFNSEGGSYVLNEPDGARTWLPSNDHPADKATWTFEITVPSRVTAVANGELVSTSPGPKGDTWVWRQDEPMATYLIQLLTGDYELIEGTGPDGLPLLSAVLRSDTDVMQVYIDTIPEQMDFLDDFFGPFPLDHYGLAMTDSFPGLAMETQGRSLFSRDDFSSGTLGYVEQLLLSHELAHQWFGNAVTLGRWQDIWLNEGFATYGEWLWLDHVGLADLDAQAQSALMGRQTSSRSPAAPSADDLFGFETYQGGATVLHALRGTVGDDLFFEILRRWAADHDGTSRVTEDFVELAEQVAGRDLTRLFDDWLHAVRPPTSYPTRD